LDLGAKKCTVIIINDEKSEYHDDSV